MTDHDDATDFENVTRTKAQEIEAFIRPPRDTAEIEDYLKQKHNLKFDYATVRYNFDPDYYRRESMDFHELVQKLATSYGLFFVVPDLVKMATRTPDDDPMRPTPNERMKEAMSSSSGLIFRDGLLRYQDRGVDVERIIRVVNVHSQNLTVTVDGTTREAEFIAERIASDIQVAQGLQPSKEMFFAKVAGKQYQCTSSLLLGAPITKLLSPNFGTFLSGTVQNEVGWKMAMLPIQPYEKSKKDYEVAVAFHEIEFSIGVFDKQSGHQYDTDLTIRSTDRNFHGSDFVTITSQLKTDDHLTLLRNLVKALTGK